MCEYCDWKAAYEEKAFNPPMIFKDMRELGKGVAQTHAGTYHKVPKAHHVKPMVVS